VAADEAVEFFDEVGGGIERDPTNSTLSDEGEEAFYLVEPGRSERASADGVPTKP